MKMFNSITINLFYRLPKILIVTLFIVLGGQQVFAGQEESAQIDVIASADLKVDEKNNIMIRLQHFDNTSDLEGVKVIFPLDLEVELNEDLKRVMSWDDAKSTMTLKQNFREELIMVTPKVSAIYGIIVDYPYGERVIQQLYATGGVQDEEGLEVVEETVEEGQSIVQFSDNQSESLYTQLLNEYEEAGYIEEKNWYRTYETVFEDVSDPNNKTVLRYQNPPNGASRKRFVPDVSIGNNPHVNSWADGYTYITANNNNFANSSPKVLQGADSSNYYPQQTTMYNLLHLVLPEENNNKLIYLSTSGENPDTSEFIYVMKREPEFRSKTIRTEYNIYNNTDRAVSRGLYFDYNTQLNRERGIPIYDLGNQRGLYMRTRTMPIRSIVYSFPRNSDTARMQYRGLKQDEYLKGTTLYSPNNASGVGDEANRNYYGKNLAVGVQNGPASTEATKMMFKTKLEKIEPREMLKVVFNVGMSEGNSAPEVTVSEDFTFKENETVEITGGYYDGSPNSKRGTIEYKTDKMSKFEKIEDYTKGPWDTEKSDKWNQKIPKEYLDIGMNNIQIRIINQQGLKSEAATTVDILKHIDISYQDMNGAGITVPNDYKKELDVSVGTDFIFSVPREIGDYEFDSVESTDVTIEEEDEKSYLVKGKVNRDQSEVIIRYRSKKADMVINFYQWVNGKPTTVPVYHDLQTLERKSSLEKKDLDVGTPIAEHIKQVGTEVMGYELLPDYKVFTNSIPPVEITDGKVPDRHFSVNFYYTPSLGLSVPTTFDFGERSITMKKETFGLSYTGDDVPNVVVSNSYEDQDKLANWQIAAKTKGLYNKETQTPLAGFISYKKGDNELVLNQEKSVIESSDRGFLSLPLASKDNQTGIFINTESAGNYSVGVYEGEIDWLLELVP